MRKSEPLLDGVVEKTQPLERTLKLRELQTSYVYTTVLAKKCRVSTLLCTLLQCTVLCQCLEHECGLMVHYQRSAWFMHASVTDQGLACSMCGPCVALSGSS